MRTCGWLGPAQPITALEDMGDAGLGTLLQDHGGRNRGPIGPQTVDLTIEFGKARFTIERHGDKLTAFDDWKADTTHV